MEKQESIDIAKTISAWLHIKTNNLAITYDERTSLAVPILQQVLDVADGIIVLFENNLPGPAFALARPMHEGYVRGVWLLNHASHIDIEKFRLGQCPNFNQLLNDIGDEPATGGAFIKEMTDLNLKSFHDLTHGGIEHVSRRTKKFSIEPNYPEEEIHRLIKVRNTYSMLVTCVLLLLAGDIESMEQLNQKKEQWRNVL